MLILLSNSRTKINEFQIFRGLSAPYVFINSFGWSDNTFRLSVCMVCASVYIFRVWIVIEPFCCKIRRLVINLLYSVCKPVRLTGDRQHSQYARHDQNELPSMWRHHSAVYINMSTTVGVNQGAATTRTKLPSLSFSGDALHSRTDSAVKRGTLSSRSPASRCRDLISVGQDVLVPRPNHKNMDLMWGKYGTIILPTLIYRLRRNDWLIDIWPSS